MANLKVKLMWMCKTETGWRRFPVIMGKNGSVKPHAVVAGGQTRLYPEGHFEIRWYEGSNKKYDNAGLSAPDALLKRAQKEQELRVRSQAREAGLMIVEPVSVGSDGRVRKPIQSEFDAFILHVESKGSPVAARAYTLAIDEFLTVPSVAAKQFMDQLSRSDMDAYMTLLRKRGCSDRTVKNRFVNVKAFFIFAGLNPRLTGSQALALEAPKFEKRTVSVYDPEDLALFFAAILNPRFFAACQIMLNCGLRDKEMRYLEWRNVHLHGQHPRIHIEGDEKYLFKVKKSEQRDIPLREDLLEFLIDYRKQHPSDSPLVCPTSNGCPNTRLWFHVKAAARRAGLNCGSCAACRERDECEAWYPHKFRATFITGCHEVMGLRSVMKLSGHSTLGSVERYLSPARDSIIREKLNKVKFIA